MACTTQLSAARTSVALSLGTKVLLSLWIHYQSYRFAPFSDIIFLGCGEDVGPRPCRWGRARCGGLLSKRRLHVGAHRT